MEQSKIIDTLEMYQGWSHAMINIRKWVGITLVKDGIVWKLMIMLLMFMDIIMLILLIHCFTTYMPSRDYIINMLGSISHQKFCFHHLPPRGWAGIKLGDACTSPTYL